MSVNWLALSGRIKTFLPAYLFLAYGLFTIGYFVFNDYIDHYRFFERLLFLPGLFFAVVTLKEIRNHPLFLWCIVYMLYLLLSGFWGVGFKWNLYGQRWELCVFLISFIGITIFLGARYPLEFDRLLKFSTVVAAIAAIVSILLFYQENSFPMSRLCGLGSLTNVNEFANIYGVFAVLAMYFALVARSYAATGFFALLVAIFFCFIWFGQSRTAFVSLCIALIAVAMLGSGKRALVYIAIVIAIASILMAVFPEILQESWQRGKGLRPAIWREVWSEAVSTPVFGHGLTSRMTLAVKIGQTRVETAHNAFLQVFWQGGAIGVLLFAGFLITAFRQAWRLGRSSGNYVVFGILLFAMGVMMTGVDTLIAPPREQWMLFWFPLALLMVYQVREKQRYDDASV